MKPKREEGPRFRYLDPSDRKAYLSEIGRLLDLDREPALHAALYFTLRFLKLARSRGQDPNACLRGLVAEQQAPAAPTWEKKLEVLTSRLEALESQSSSTLEAASGPGALPPLPASAARRMQTARLGTGREGDTLTPITMVASGAPAVEQLLSKAEPATRQDYRSCRRTHRTLKF